MHPEALDRTPAVELLGGRDGHRIRGAAWRGGPVVSGRSASAGLAVLRPPAARSVAVRSVGNRLSPAIRAVDVGRVTGDRAPGATADSSRCGMVRGAGVLSSSRIQLSGGGRSPIRPGHLHGLRQSSVPGAMAGFRTLARCAGVRGVRNAGVESASSLLADLRGVRGLHAGAPAARTVQGRLASGRHGVRGAGRLPACRCCARPGN